MVKVVAIIQARLSSSRLPAKVMLDLMGKTLLERVVERVKLAQIVKEIWIATSSNIEDDIIEELAKRINIKCYRGSLENVISRYYETAKLSKSDIIVRVTADNPLTEPTYIDKAVQLIIEKNFDYVSFKNIIVGTGVEAFTLQSFEDIMMNYTLTEHNIEHVTSFYYQNEQLFNNKIINQNIDSKNKINMQLTVDTFKDYVNVNNLLEKLLEKNIEQKNYLNEILNGKLF